MPPLPPAPSVASPSPRPRPTGPEALISGPLVALTPIAPSLTTPLTRLPPHLSAPPPGMAGTPGDGPGTAAPRPARSAGPSSCPRAAATTSPRPPPARGGTGPAAAGSSSPFGPGWSARSARPSPPGTPPTPTAAPEPGVRPRCPSLKALPERRGLARRGGRAAPVSRSGRRFGFLTWARRSRVASVGGSRWSSGTHRGSDAWARLRCWPWASFRFPAWSAGHTRRDSPRPVLLARPARPPIAPSPLTRSGRTRG